MDSLFFYLLVCALSLLSRIVLSDGASYISGMLATQLAPVRFLILLLCLPFLSPTCALIRLLVCLCLQLMESESLKMNYVVQLKDYIGNDVQGRR